VYSIDAAVFVTDVPEAPRHLRIHDLAKNSVTLAWDAPESDGGGAISGYLIEKQSSYSSRWVPLNRAPVTTQMYTIRDVTEGEDCEFRVLAVNEAGTGPASDSTGIVRPQDTVSKPSRPGQLAVELDSDKRVAELRWTRPKDDGQSPITNYVVEMKSSKYPKWKVSYAPLFCFPLVVIVKLSQMCN
jgi:titin